MIPMHTGVWEIEQGRKHSCERLGRARCVIASGEQGEEEGNWIGHCTELPGVSRDNACPCWPFYHPLVSSDHGMMGLPVPVSLLYLLPTSFLRWDLVFKNPWIPHVWHHAFCCVNAHWLHARLVTGMRTSEGAGGLERRDVVWFST